MQNGGSHAQSSHTSVSLKILQKKWVGRLNQETNYYSLYVCVGKYSHINRYRLEVDMKTI